MEQKITAWIARDENGRVFLYSKKPHKFYGIGVWHGKILGFPQVKWGDKEPTEIELTIIR